MKNGYLPWRESVKEDKPGRILTDTIIDGAEGDHASGRWA